MPSSHGFLKTRGLGTGTTFMRAYAHGSHIRSGATPSRVAGTVLFKSEHEPGSEYTENIYIHLKLIFAFAAQSSLSEVRNDNVRNAV